MTSKTIIEHINDYPQTMLLMQDVYQSLIGKKVSVYTKGTIVLGGKLVASNGAVIALSNNYGQITYFSTDNIQAIEEWSEPIWNGTVE